MTLTPEQRLSFAHERLDAWLADLSKLDDPIEAALDDLGGFLDELHCVVTDECAHAKTRCWDCVQGNVRATQEEYGRLRELWERRS